MKQRWLVGLLVPVLLAGCASGARQSQPEPQPLPEPTAAAPPVAAPAPAPLPPVQPPAGAEPALPDLMELLKGQPGVGPAVSPAYRWKRPPAGVAWEALPDGRLLLRSGVALTMLAPDGTTQWSRTWDGPLVSMTAQGEELVLREQQGAVFVLSAADGHTLARWSPAPGAEAAVTVTPAGFVALTRTQRGVTVATPDGVLGTIAVTAPAGTRLGMFAGVGGEQFAVAVPGRMVSVYGRDLRLQWVLPLQEQDQVRYAAGTGIIWIVRMGGKLEAWSPQGNLLVRFRYDPAVVAVRRVLDNGALVLAAQAEYLLTPEGQLLPTGSGDEIWAYRL